MTVTVCVRVQQEQNQWENDSIISISMNLILPKFLLIHSNFLGDSYLKKKLKSYQINIRI